MCVDYIIPAYLDRPARLAVQGDRRGPDGRLLRSVFKISCLFLRPRLWQFEI